ncbi:hypothetical protein E7744_07165 [Citricoccus sp. SGAir0253]|uniref:hypothetical protein n=1 Tax=Citricoccus sp. SGAir0253 TaxID=2567881 RepID=UPI0010CCD685|nr:hypothetical protein [Citricoccus sp. SGAir0253]QCU77986.1 hypothetical protein E7744_07165 [Citricoccus sp. SGAir0253]
MAGNPWVDDEDDDTWLNQAPSPGPADGGAPGSPLTYLDPEVEAALAAEGPPEWLGTRWRQIEPGQQWDAWNGLRRWVDWFIREYRLTTSDVPACWYRHPDLTAELYAAMCMEYKVWEEQAPGLAPMMMWHPNVAQLRSRLKEMTHEAGCVQAGKHKEPVAYSGAVGAYELDYDEDDWITVASTIRTEKVIDRPTTGVKYVRARAVDADGTEHGASDPLGLQARSVAGLGSVALAYTSTTPGQAGVTVNIAGGPENLTVVWEESADGTTWAPMDAGDEDTQDRPQP